MSDNISVKEYKLKIGGKEYTFRMDFEALSKYQSRYDDMMLTHFNEDILQGRHQYDCMVNIMCCACVEKEWEPKELKHELGFNYPRMHEIDKMVSDMMGNTFNEEGEDNQKNK